MLYGVQPNLVAQGHTNIFVYVCLQIRFFEILYKSFTRHPYSTYNRSLQMRSLVQFISTKPVEASFAWRVIYPAVCLLRLYVPIYGELASDSQWCNYLSAATPLHLKRACTDEDQIDAFSIMIRLNLNSLNYKRHECVGHAEDHICRGDSDRYDHF